MNDHHREILEREAAYIASVIAAELPEVDAEIVRNAAYTALVALESGGVAARLFVDYHRGPPNGRPQLLESFRRLLNFWPELWQLIVWVAARVVKRV